MTRSDRALTAGPGPLSAHFDAGEFACRCSVGRILISLDLVDVLEEIRCELDAPVRVVSGYRCPVRNLEQGGAPRSWHTVGLAADVQVAQEHRERLKGLLVDLVKADRFRYVEWHDSFVHVDVGF